MAQMIDTRIAIDEYDTEHLRIVVDADEFSGARAKAWVNALPQVKLIDPDRLCWSVPVTTSIVDQINVCELNLDISPEAQALMALSQARLKVGDLNALTVANYKANKIVPEHSLPLHPDFPLAAYQQAAAICALRTTGFGLFMEQGTGKTATAVSIGCRLWEEKHERFLDPEDDEKYDSVDILVLAPKNVRHNWVAEFEKFAYSPHFTREDVEILDLHTPFCDPAVARGTIQERVRGILEQRVSKAKIRVVILSYDSLATTPIALSLKWDLAIADESHYFKDPKSKRWQWMQKLRPQCSMRLALTGTPVANNAMDLYTQFEWMGVGVSGFTSYKAYKDFFGVELGNFNVAEDQQGFARIVGMQNVPVLKETLARNSFIISKREALPDLPDEVFDAWEVELSSEQKLIYEKVERELAYSAEEALDAVEDGNEQQKAMTIQNVLVQFLRLSQIVSGYVVWDEECDPYSGEVTREKRTEPLKTNTKLAALRELLDSCDDPYSKKIIWCHWIFDVEAVAEMLGDECVTYYGATTDPQREQAIWRFNNDDSVKYFVSNPSAGGTGVNLLGYDPKDCPDSPYNADHVIYYSCNWSANTRRQSQARCHRRGTRNNIRITELVAPATMDEQIRAAVIGKIKAATELGDLREIVQSLVAKYAA